MKALLVILLSFNIAYADCPPVKRIEKGQISECTGYIFSPEKELEVRIRYEQYDTMEKKIQNQQEISNILEQRLKNDREYIASLETNRDRQFWRETGYFILGAVLTGFIATNVGR